MQGKLNYKKGKTVNNKLQAGRLFRRDFKQLFKTFSCPGREGGGVTPLCKPYRYVPPHRVGFLRRFGLKTGLIHFAHFGLESGRVFEGITGLYERLYHFTVKSSQAYPPRTINEFIIQKLNPLLVVDFRLISALILACVMSREFTREAVMKFLPAPFS